MEFEYRRPELEQALMDARTLDELEAAMNAVAALTPDLGKPEFRGRQMFSRGLDATIPVLARRLNLADVPLAKSNDNVCIVGTQFFAQGGHSKVAMDISQLIGAERTTLIMTDVYRNMHHGLLLSPPKDGALRRRASVLLSAGTLVGKTLELYNILAALRPTRVFLLSHHFDMVAPVALWPFREVVEYLHHADHLPTLGATLGFSAHVDLSWRSHQACSAAGLSPVYAGMTASAGGRGKTEANLPADKPAGRLRMATCGSLGKYQGVGAHRWTDYAVAALSLPDAELIHIGPVDDAFRGEVVNSLIEAKISPERYIFAGPTADLATELEARRVDVYLSSYPEYGGKANLEAMAVGLPPIVATDEQTPPLLRFDFPRPTWIGIGAPRELEDAIGRSLRLRADADAMRRQVNEELARFERYVSEPPASKSA